MRNRSDRVQPIKGDGRNKVKHICWPAMVQSIAKQKDEAKLEPLPHTLEDFYPVGEPPGKSHKRQ